MISHEAKEWLNAIVRRHRQTRKVLRTLPTAKKKPPATGGVGVGDAAAPLE